MNLSSGFINAMLSMVSATEISPERIAAPPTVCRIAFMSPAPNFWAVSTVKPAVMPRTKPMIRNMIVPVLPTAARAFVPTNFPTIIVSAIL